ncbi:hypothetical protein [Hyphomicrobium sp.]|uniref:hypothetical protein n=1 Tax=Hyphomicrobium sp. TaxID=82 RepID=UPI0025BD5B30|nr:hypothetical protein [Hyphomicrobium sp.]MCC7252297.1 hypothetical protein [Hyphomicrobium sp.]
MRRLLIALAILGALHATPTRAAGGKGCDGFLWPLATELSWMKAADSAEVASGATLKAPPSDKAIELKLVPAAEATLPATPTSTPKPEDASAFGGVVNVEALEAGHYQVTLSGDGWIDVVQNDTALEATGHTGSKDCDGIRKSVRFEIGPGPFALQVSGARKEHIRIAIRPAAD